MKRLFAAIIAIVLMSTALFSVAYAASQGITEVMIISCDPNEYRAELEVRFVAKTASDMSYGTVAIEDLNCDIDGIKTPVKYGPSANDGIGYIFVVDASFYYSQYIPFGLTKSYLKAAIGDMQAQDRCAFVVVGESVIENPFTDRESALTYLEGLSASDKRYGDCLLYEGISKAIDMAGVDSNQVPDQKMIVIISDGIDTNSPVTFEQVQEKAQALSDIPVIGAVLLHSKASGFNDSKLASINDGRNQLIKLCSSTNGSFYGLIDANYKDSDNIAAAEGRRLTNFGRNIQTVTLNIIDVSLAHSSNNQYTLQMMCNNDGRVVDAQYELAMFASQIPTPTPTVAPTPEPTPAWPILLGADDRVNEIKYTQRKLKDLYYLSDEPTGIFDDVLMAALDELYTINGLEKAEGLSKEAYDLLRSGDAIPHPTATPTPSPTPTATPDANIAIFPGDTGAVVREAQYKLEQLGFYKTKEGENPSSSFDEQMQIATDAFCRSNGLPICDGMSKKALELLKEGNPNTPTPEPTATPEPRPDNMVLLPGDESNDVKTAQRRLAQLYYYTLDEDGNTYGVFDKTLQLAIDQFCVANDLPTVEGMSTDAWNVMISASAIPMATPVPMVTPAPFAMGDKSSEINDYQIRLNALGYYEDEFVPSEYDEATQMAQNRLCEVNNLAMESGASVELQQRVFSDDILPNVEPDFATKVKKFVLSDVALFGLEAPMWVVLAVSLILVAGTLILIVMLIVGKKKEKYPISNVQDMPMENYGYSGGSEGGIVSGEDAPTSDVVFSGSEAPTSVNEDGCNVTFSIEFEGFSDDVSYMFTPGRPLTIGRSKDADIKLNQRDSAVSRMHGVLEFRNNSMFYKDTSSHGTIVDGHRVEHSESQLKSGSELIISNHRVTVHY